MGASSTWLSPCIKILQSSDGPLSPPMTSKELGWAGSLICLGGLLGMPMFNWVVRNKGRKAAAYSVGLPFAVSYIFVTVEDYNENIGQEFIVPVIRLHRCISEALITILLYA